MHPHGINECRTRSAIFSSLRSFSILCRLLSAEWAAGPVFDEGLQTVIVAEDGGAQLQDGLGSIGVVPELLGSFHAIIEFQDQGLHHAGGHRESLLAILDVFHALLI